MPVKKSTTTTATEPTVKPAAKRTAKPIATVPNTPEPATTNVTVEVTEPSAYEALDRLERIQLMKAEAAATHDWIVGGRVGPEPARPVNTAYALHVLAKGGSVRFTTASTGERKSRSNFQPDALADVLARITAMRDEGVGWPTIAKRFNDEGVPTAKGGRWASSTVMGIAKRAGMPTRLATAATA